MRGLKLIDLHVKVGKKEILKGVNLNIPFREIHAVMGPNGGGKSTLSFAIMGHPKYKVTKGKILFNGKNITDLSPDERAKTGIFLGFQYPSEVSGVPLSSFLLSSYRELYGKEVTRNKKKEKEVNIIKFYSLLKEKMKELGIHESFSKRYLNEGFSGGEKKRTEILQMAVLQPKIAILDEIDSGLDIDALRTVAKGINSFAGKNNSVLLITHYQRILNYVKPSKLHVMIDGRIVKTGSFELVKKIEEHGYDWIKRGVVVG